MPKTRRRRTAGLSPRRARELIVQRIKPLHSQVLKELQDSFKKYEQLMEAVAELGRKANDAQLIEHGEKRAKRVDSMWYNLYQTLGDDLFAIRVEDEGDEDDFNEDDFFSPLK